ncbi:MAG: MFS transporter [Planctomycetota bacterium]|nr:MFS transporter [Planctomycetota bacterium]MDA0933528.1 MFS transporter [Planctomycetota bacterium]
MLAVAALAATCFGMSLNANVLAALNPYLEQALGLAKPELGALGAAAGLAGTVAALLLGPTVDRLGRRPPLLAGTAAFLVASLGYFVAGSFASLIAIRVATGFAAGVVLTSASSAVADLIPYERRGFAMGIVTGAILLAVPLGMPVALLFAEAGHWRGIFALQVAAAVVTLVALVRVLPEGLGKGSGGESQWTVLRHPGVAPALGSMVLYNGAFFASMQFLGTWLDEVGILAKASQGGMWITLGLVSAVGGMGLTKVADRIGKRAFVLLATAIVGGGLVMLARVEDMSMLVIVGVPVGIVSAARSGALLALVSELVPQGSRGTLMGVRTAAVTLGTGTFPWLAGEVYAAEGFPAFLRIAGISVGVAWVLVRFGVAEPTRAGR